MNVYLNGEYLERAQAHVSVDDRGFVFGDGVYEVMRAIRGALFEPGRHLARLAYGLEGLRIAPPAECTGCEVVPIAERLLRDNGLVDGEALVYLQVTRGAAPRTHQFPAAAPPATVFMNVRAFEPLHELRARGAATITIPDIRWSRCDLKTVNLLPNVLGKQRAVDAGVAEALFVRDGVVIEGSTANFFAVIDGEVRTYPACNYILSGVTRDVVLELAVECGLPVRHAPILVDDLRRASELFLTSTTNDVMPVVEVDGHAIGTGKPGPVAQRLYAALAERLGRVGA
jgi:D-alanine transaminase